MQCQEFIKLTAVLVKDRDTVLSAEMQQQWEEHLFECEACMAFYQHQLVGDQQLSVDESEALTDSILQATTVAQDELDSKLDGMLGGLLSEMQSMDPPTDFTSSVMVKTASLQRFRRTKTRWKQKVLPLFLRPRFAQELSFAATIGWALLFGLPNEEFIDAETFSGWVEQITAPLKPGTEFTDQVTR